MTARQKGKVVRSRFQGSDSLGVTPLLQILGKLYRVLGSQFPCIEKENISEV
jgi:hypothetical protein